jgi:hypothetical protein
MKTNLQENTISSISCTMFLFTEFVLINRHCIKVSDLCSFVIIQTTYYNFLKGMEGDLNNTDLVEWYENENSIENEISNAGSVSSTKNIEDQDIDSIDVQTEGDSLKHAYQRKPRRKTSIVWKNFTEMEIKGVKKH